MSPPETTRPRHDGRGDPGALHETGGRSKCTMSTRLAVFSMALVGFMSAPARADPKVSLYSDQYRSLKAEATELWRYTQTVTFPSSVEGQEKLQSRQREMNNLVERLHRLEEGIAQYVLDRDKEALERGEGDHPADHAQLTSLAHAAEAMALTISAGSDYLYEKRGVYL